ncbi:MAG TPA: DUF488 domain-containing protein, partial [Burkholderiales bacterium]|nr:DUF488 domain-containing protein [Burkholderiales bacterium]
GIPITVVSSMRAIRTIGYEDSSINEFIETLVSTNITFVLDIREIPVSRRKGFSKKILSQRLINEGIGYRHVKALGSPKEIRDRLRKSGDFERFFNEYDRYLLTQQDCLKSIADELTGSVALLCYERDPKYCHRKSVARELSKITGKKPLHLGVKKY